MDDVVDEIVPTLNKGLSTLVDVIGPQNQRKEGILLTIAIHVAVAAIDLSLLYAIPASGGGIVSVQIVAVQFAFLIGVVPGPDFLANRGLWWMPKPDDEKIIVLFFIGLVHFFGVGIIEYVKLEEGIETFIDGLYFVMVLLTTVGYGNTFAPSTPACRLFTVAYAAYGLLIFGAATSLVAKALGSFVGHVSTGIKMRLGGILVLGWKPKDPKEKPAKPAFTPPPAYYTVRDMYKNFALFLLFNFGGAAIFYAVEEDWNFVDGLYHCFMTATTIGLGDIAPTTQAGRLIAVFHMVSSVLVLGGIIGAIVGSLDRRAHDEKLKKMLEKQLDEELILSLDKDGNGVDRAEFVLGMLVALGTLTEDDYLPFMKQYDTLDVNGDGNLNKEDLKTVVEMNRTAQAEAKARAKSTSCTYQKRAVGHATQLIVPTGICCMGFVWHNVYGYLFLTAGLLNLNTICLLLGWPPSVKLYRVIGGLATASALVLTAAIALMIMSISSVRLVLQLAPLVKETQLLASLDDNGRTVTETNATAVQVIEDQLVAEYSGNATLSLLFAMFTLIFGWMLNEMLKVLVCTQRAKAECELIESGMDISDISGRTPEKKPVSPSSNYPSLTAAASDKVEKAEAPEVEAPAAAAPSDTPVVDKEENKTVAAAAAVVGSVGSLGRSLTNLLGVTAAAAPAAEEAKPVPIGRVASDFL